MDKYSRLLLHLSTVSGSDNDPEPYPNFVNELTILQNPSDELCQIIADDLPTILPALLILANHDDIGVRTAVANSYDTFSNILKERPSVKNDAWWKEMEEKLIAQQYSSKLLKMVEGNIEPWSRNWVFVMKLIVVHSEQVHSAAINSLLKVVEVAFKLSKKNVNILERSYFCWNQLIDIFSVHPRVTVSQKLVELFVRPLSTSHLSHKCPELKLQVWNNLMRKIGFSCGNKCKFIIGPFIENMYLKNEESLYIKFANECLKSFDEIVQQKTLYKHFAMKVLPGFPVCCKSINDEEMENLVLKIWAGIIDNIPCVNKEQKNEYVTKIFIEFIQVHEQGKTELNNKLMNVLIEKNVFTVVTLRMCIHSQAALISMFSILMQYDEFRSKSFASVVKSLNENSSESTNKQQSNMDLEIWDLLCDTYSERIKHLENPQQLYIAEIETLNTLLMVPFSQKQWSVGAVQKTWYSLVDTVLTTPGAANTFLPSLFENLIEGVKSSRLTVGACIEICTHLTEKEKLAFKMMMPLLNIASQQVSPKEPKPLMDLMVLLENAVSCVPKNDLSKFVNELLADVNKYEHPWGIRIKTKCSKVQRKLLVAKDMTEEQDEKEKPQSSSSDQLNGPKTRSPVMAHSNFLHRLAKAEEKKKMKVPTHASVFGETSTGPKKGAPAEAFEKSEVSEKMSLNKKSVPSDKDQESGSPDIAVPLENGGRLSPAIPSTVCIVNSLRATRSRSRSKSPEPVLTKPKRQTLSKVAPSPPTYFDETAQGDFVMIPPKPKSTPLTDHQKEMLSKRRSDIPALYQDLSQDTQSQSQSIREINLHAFEGTSEKSEPFSLTSKSENKIVLPCNQTDVSKTANSILEPCSYSPGDNPSSGSNGLTVTNKVDKEIISESSSDLQISSVDMFSSTNNSELNGLQNNDNLNVKSNNNNSSENDSSSTTNLRGTVEIKENGLQTETPVSLSLTPTKQPEHPTPRNLVSKLNLIEDMEEEEEEREKENKITNAKLNAEKTMITPVKRRSMRKLHSKNTEDTKDTKVKQKRDLSDVPKIIIDSPDTPVVTATTQNINKDTSVNKCMSPSSQEEQNQTPEEESIEPLKENRHDSDINKNNIPELVTFDKDKNKSVNEVSDITKPLHFSNDAKELVAEPTVCNIQLNDTVMFDDNEINVKESVVNQSEHLESVGVALVSEENSESPSSWAITSAVPMIKNKKKTSLEKQREYSPKQLRSKRLSLTKNQDPGDSAKKKKRGSTLKKINSSDNTHLSTDQSDKTLEELKNQELNVLNIEEKDTEKTLQAVKIELTPTRKRRNTHGESGEVDEKKKRKEEDTCQESLLTVKNNLSGKPRKKKVIKTNIKISPNNLEQWLIKSGKNVVKTSLVSQENGNSETEYSKIIECSPDIQINVSQTNNIVVEKKETLSPSNEALNDENDLDEGYLTGIVNNTENSTDEKMEVEEVQKCTLTSTSPGLIQAHSSSDEESGLDAVRCEENEVPSTPEIDAQAYIARRRLIRREGTPAREILPEVEEDGRKQVTPMRSQRPGRSAQMVMMATSDEERSVPTPVRKRSSILPFNKTDNWPEGRMEQWIPFLPTPPGVSPSSGILKRRAIAVLSPNNSPSSSPQVRRKRVSFLDPVVFSGLMYAKGCSDPTGEVQYANIPPGEKPIWKADNEEKDEEMLVDLPCSDNAMDDPVETVPIDNTDNNKEQNKVIQEFMSSTPDAPWSKTFSPSLEFTSIAKLSSLTEPVEEFLSFLFSNDESIKIAAEELHRLNVYSLADLQTVQTADLDRICKQIFKKEALTTIIEKKKKRPSKRIVKADDTKSRIQSSSPV